LCCSQKPTTEVKTSLTFIYFFQQVKRFSKYERKPLIWERFYLTHIYMYRHSYLPHIIIIQFYEYYFIKWTILHSQEQPAALYIVWKTLHGMCTAGLPFSISRIVSLTSLSSTNWTHFTPFPIRKAVQEFTRLSFEWKHCSIWFVVTDILGEYVVIFPIKPATFLTWLTSALKMKALCSS
jgi:hypothetical protein